MKCSTKQAKYIMDNLPSEIRYDSTVEFINDLYAKVQQLEGWQAFGIITHIKEANDASWASRVDDMRDHMDEVMDLLREYNCIVWQNYKKKSQKSCWKT